MKTSQDEEDGEGEELSPPGDAGAAHVHDGVGHDDCHDHLQSADPLQDLHGEKVQPNSRLLREHPGSHQQHSVQGGDRTRRGTLQRHQGNFSSCHVQNTVGQTV